MNERWCRVCGAQVLSDDAWVELPNLGRFWLCPRHERNAVGMMYLGDKGERLVLGPYPYEREVTVNDLVVGDPVVRLYDGWTGHVRAIYPNEPVDDTEVEFFNGVFTRSNHREFLKLAAEEPAS